LDLITDLLGTPSLEAMRTACEGAKAHILRGPHKQVKRGSLSLAAGPKGRISIPEMLLTGFRYIYIHGHIDTNRYPTSKITVMCI
jgi:hypothetical protein